MYSRFLKEGYCPDLWRHYYITPIYKKGDPTLAENYRPISILPSSLIFFEQILSNHLIYFLRNNNLINDNQYGFLSGKSNDLQLLKLYRAIFKAKDNSKSSDIIYFNIVKAFDNVSHKLLLHKLFNIGIHGDVLKWNKSYLFNKIQSVKMNSNMSIPPKCYTYISELCSKAYRYYNMIFRSFITNDYSPLVCAYLTYIRPILEYGSYVWNPHSNYIGYNKLLEKV